VRTWPVLAKKSPCHHRFRPDVDHTITRLGQNSAFSFRDGGRTVELKQGSVLLQVPKNHGGATIRTATVTAAITGTTVMFEYNPGKWIKLITLEGTQKLYLNGSKHFVSVPAGKMIIMNPNSKFIPQPVSVDIAKIMATSALVSHQPFGRLPDRALELIQQTIHDQLIAKRNGILLPTGQIVTGPGIQSAGVISNTISNLRLPNSSSNQSYSGSFNSPP
jgi:hypothetical protein